MTSSLPLLIATSAPKAARARLVDVSVEAEVKIAQALNQPRVGVLGIEQETVGADAFLRFLQENIAPVNVSWLDQQSSPTYHPVKIDTVTTAAKAKGSARGRKMKIPDAR